VSSGSRGTLGRAAAHTEVVDEAVTVVVDGVARNVCGRGE
jgi:hypothetical protein